MAVPPVGLANGAFDFEAVVQQARELAAAEHQDRRLPLKGEFADLEYDEYRDIRFDTGKSPFDRDGSEFAMDLLPPGWLFDQRVDVHVVSEGTSRRIDYSNDWFEFGLLASAPDNPDALSFSGFRLRSPINRPDILDEIAVFQGASYFRAVARDQLYGLSARALAIGTASEQGEEFPRFTAFWIEEPSPDSPSVSVHALLDSPSVTGALSFDIIPGADTSMDVKSVLFARRDMPEVGLAPLTSMFLYDNTNRERFNDYRDAVHDSNGVQIVNGDGERLWRSLANPQTLQVSSFVDRNPVGFGLVQRQREFTDYEDAEARYERRPSAWVQPTGDWGEGDVRLVEIPTDKEINDNIVAFWRPKEGLAKGEEYRYGYRLLWTDQPPDEVPLMRVSDVRIGRRVGRPEVREVVVDFEVDKLPEQVDVVADLQVSAGETRHVTSVFLPDEKRLRVHFDYHPDADGASEWRLKLLDGKDALSETWLYRWTP